MIRHSFTLVVALAAPACSSAPPPAATCPPTAPLQWRIEQLEAKVAKLEAQPKNPAPATPPAQPAEPPSETEEQRAARIDKRFLQDAAGGSAADAFEAEYKKVFRLPAAKGASLRSIECNQVLCRAFVVLDSDHIHNKFFITAMREAGMSRYGATAARREHTADGKTTVTVYIAQHGDIPND